MNKGALTWTLTGPSYFVLSKWTNLSYKKNLQRFLRSLHGTGTNRPRTAPTDSDRPQLGWTGNSLGPVCAGPYRVSTDLCRSMSIVKHRQRPLETRYGPAQTGPRLVLVQASLGRYGAGLNRSVPVPVGSGRGRSGPVSAGAAWSRCRPVSVPRRNRKKRCCYYFVKKIDSFLRT